MRASTMVELLVVILLTAILFAAVMEGLAGFVRLHALSSRRLEGRTQAVEAYYRRALVPRPPEGYADSIRLIEIDCGYEDE